MPLAQGFITEEQKELLEKHVVDGDNVEDVGEALEIVVRFYLYNKHHVET